MSTPSRVPDSVEAVFLDLRWPQGPVCPFCATESVYALGGGRAVRRRFKCASCRRQFTVTKGTILENSRLSLDMWLRVATLLTVPDAPRSSTALAGALGIGRAAARNLVDRLRYAVRRPPLRDLLRGVPPDTSSGAPNMGTLTAEDLLRALLATHAPTTPAPTTPAPQPLVTLPAPSPAGPAAQKAAVEGCRKGG